MARDLRAVRSGILDAVHLLFPPRCLCCGEAVASDFGLCPACWHEADFITGPCCERCGAPLPGAAEDADAPLHCDDCLAAPPPWDHGRAALRYAGTGRRLVLALKHGDRLDLVKPLAAWMIRAARPLVTPEMIVAPVPLHRLRLVTRRYNQSALLARALARGLGLAHQPDLLQRTRVTPSQEGRDRDARHANLAGAIAPHPRRGALIHGKPVLLVDDVMTSGATLGAATRACLDAGAISVSVVVLARVARD